MRINQVARKHGLENKEILDYLESIGVEGKSHSSSIDDGTLEMLLQHYGKLDKPVETEPKRSKRFARIRRPKNYKAPTTPSPHEQKEEIKPKETKVPQTQVATAPLEEPPVVNAVHSPEHKEQRPQPVAKDEQRAPVERSGNESVTTSVLPVQHDAPPPQVEPIAPTVQKDEPKQAPPAETTVAKTAPQDTHKDEKPVQSVYIGGTKDKPKPEPRKPKHEPKKDKPEHKKSKHKPLPLDAKSSEGPTFIIEAPEIKEEDIVPPKTDVIEPVPARENRDQDDAIRKEIQKLKAKQRRLPEKEEEKKDKQQPPRRRRPQPTAVKSKGKRAWKREKRERLEQQIALEQEREEKEKTTIQVNEATTVADIANTLDIPPNELIAKLIEVGVMASINQRLDYDTIQIIADDFGFQVEKVDMFDSDIFTQLWEEDIDKSRMVNRPPIITVMGHVDHGKTKLLDAVRSTDVVSTEAGGITQHIGAYYVKTPSGDMVFLDTPGHEAFTAMRARGAMVTDIVILVVAATDGVMPQTREAISHAKAANVPIIVAVNKIDLEGANMDRVKQQLAENGLQPEEWGGNTVVVPISALKREGIENLLENVTLQAELLELKADPECRARGTIVEGRLEQGRGPVATVLMQQGTLRVGDPFVSGVYSGRIRAMTNDRGETMTEAGPAMPVEIIGIEDVPTAGDPFAVVKDDSQAKEISTRLQQIQRERELRSVSRITLEDLHTQIEEGKVKELRVILKGDVQGSVGALSESLLKIESDKVRVEIIHSGVGTITESDVMLASASNALIIGFNIRPQPNVIELSKSEHVEIRTYRIIYDAIADIRKAMTGMLDKAYEENVLGRAQVREVFKTSKGISIAGLYVTNGKLMRNASVRLLRDSVVIYEGKLTSLKRFKDDVREVASNYECGIGLENYSDIKVGDEIECYEMKEVATTL